MNALGGKPISPRQIERSLVMARDRRQECSRVRSSLPKQKEVSKVTEHHSVQQDNFLMTSLTSSSDSDNETGAPYSNQLTPWTKQVKKPKTRTMQIGIKHRTNIKFKLPI